MSVNHAVQDSHCAVGQSWKVLNYHL
jgi:hypothetical protein